MGKDIPGWVSAAVAVVALLCGGVGIYAGISSKLDVFATEMVTVKREVAENTTYDSYLQSQIDELKARVIKAEIRLEFFEKDNEELKELLEGLKDELKAMREELILANQTK